MTSSAVAGYAAAVFRLGAVSAMIYLPEGTDPAAHGIPGDPGALKTLIGDALPDSPPAPWPSAAPVLTSGGSAPGRLGATAAPVFETVTLAGGVTFSCRVDPAVPVAALAFVVAGGATAETPAESGLATLTSLAQVKGAAGLDAEELHGRLEGLGAVLSPLADMGTHPNLRFVRIDGDYPITLAAAWKKGNDNPAISLFVELLKKIGSLNADS